MGARRKSKPRNVKLVTGVLLIAPVLFAIDDASFVGEATQPELQQPFLDDMANVLRLPLSEAVQDNVVAVPLEPHHWDIPGKPGVQRVVQGQIRQ
jgi:hypothetical protein